jgi:hypothetical protein
MITHFALSFVSQTGALFYLSPISKAKSTWCLTATNGVQLHADVLNQIGVPGVLIKGKLIENGDQRVLAVEELEH